MTNYQRDLLQRMISDNLFIRVLIEDGAADDISLADDENDYLRVRSSTLQSLLDQEVIEPTKDWQPSTQIEIIEYRPTKPRQPKEGE